VSNISVRLFVQDGVDGRVYLDHRVQGDFDSIAAGIRAVTKQAEERMEFTYTELVVRDPR
jgi:hypothetical protein